MKNLKRLVMSFTLIAVLSTAVFAGETNTPPCVPGETSSPPCPTQSVTEDPDAVVLGETETSPALPAVDITDISEAVLWALSLF